MSSANPKILIINPYGIGDVLFTIPLVRNLKHHFPQSVISYLSNRRCSQFLQHYSYIDKVFVYERDEFKSLLSKSFFSFLKESRQLFDSIRNSKFDYVIDFSLNGSFSFLSWINGIPKRIGFNYKNRSPYLTKKIPLSGYESKHVVEYYLSILDYWSLPVMDRHLDIPVSTEAEAWVKQQMKERGVSLTQLRIGLVPGGGASWGKDAHYKRWRAENYAKLADKMVEKLKAQIILMGSLEEKDISRRIVELAKHKIVDFSAETSILQLAHLFQSCSAVVVNDGGPLHLAVASGTKTVSIFGPVDPVVYGPYPLSRDHRVVVADVVCRPCYRQFRRAQCSHISCLNLITTEDVLRKVEEVL